MSTTSVTPPEGLTNFSRIVPWSDLTSDSIYMLSKPSVALSRDSGHRAAVRPSGHVTRKVAMACRAEPSTGDKAARDNKSTQLNPNNPNYQGGSTKYGGQGDKADLDNHGQQLNPNHPKHEPSKDKK